MGLSWQQGPLSAGAIGHFLTPEPLGTPRIPTTASTSEKPPAPWKSASATS